jgi:hypothetical protein
MSTIATPRRVVETEAERRGRLQAEQPGEFVFQTTDDYIAAMAAQVRQSGLKPGSIAKASDTIKSGTTVSKLASGQTHFPRFSTMFGVAAALGVEVVFRRRGARK